MSHLPYQGRISIRPSFVQIQDRADGTWWTLMHRASDDRWGISDAALSRYNAFNVRRYAAGQEPFLPGHPELRFIIRGGRVGVEVIEPDVPVRDRDQAPITTRVGNTRLTLAIEDDEYVNDGRGVGYGVLNDG